MTRALTVGVFTSISLTASGGTKPYTYSIISGLPAGLTLNASTGVISGTPTTAQASTAIAWQVEDALAATASDSFNVVVQAVPVAVPHYRFLVELAGLFRLRGALVVGVGQSADLIGGAVAGGVLTASGPIVQANLIGGAVAGGVLTTREFTGASLIGGSVAGGVLEVSETLRADLVGGGVAGGVLETLTLWTPAQITTALWLDASDATTLFDATTGGSLPAADGQIARWEDNSGNARHLTQATSGSRPIRKTADLNGLDGIRMDGTDDHLFRAGLQLGLINRTIIAVFKENAVSTNAGVLSLNPTSGSDFNSSSGLIFGTSERVSFKRFAVTGSTGSSYDVGDASNISVQIPPITYIEVKSSGTGSLYRDGTSTDTDSSFTEFSSLSGGGIVLGGRYSSGSITGNYLNGTYYEVIYCESSLSTDDRQRVEGYIAHKWGTTADLPGGHPYKTTPPYV